jgi:uncharacterized membrane protein (DUF373 family)
LFIDGFLALAMQKKKVPFQHKGQIDKISFSHPRNLSWWFFFFLFAVNFLLHRGVQQMRKLFKRIAENTKDDKFMHFIENIEVLVSKLLSLFMVIVIVAAIVDLGFFLFKELFYTPHGEFNAVLFEIFSLFLNILIALEILENITGYLKKHVLQIELVIVTSLIAVARKIIILDLRKVTGIDIIGLGIAILALSISYLIIRFSNKQNV